MFKRRKSSEGSRWLLPSLLVLTATVLTPPLALCPDAEAFIYWGETRGDPFTGTIARANPDGSGVNESFISRRGKYVGAVASNPEHLYWHETSGQFDPGAIGRARLDGTRVNEAFFPSKGTGAFVGALGTDYIYWPVNPALCPVSACSPDYLGASIARLDIDATRPAETNFIAGFEGPVYGMAVDSGHIYWAKCHDDDPAAVGRANLDGSEIEPQFISVPNPTSCPTDVAVDGEHVYWTNRFPNYSIGRANLDGTGVDQDFIKAAAAPFTPTELEVVAGHLYWINGYPNHSIARADLDGTTVEGDFMTPAGRDLSGLAGDALSDKVSPKTTLTKGMPNRTDQHAGKFKFKSSEPSSAFECKLDKKKWKPCTSPKTLKHLDDGKHKFRVRAIDAAGNTDPTPAKDKFRVVRE